MFPKAGRFVPVSPEDYAATISAALVNDLGDSHRSIKMIGRWTGACERTATNWLNGEAGPRGHHLVGLIAHSDEVLAALLMMAGRRQTVSSIKLYALRDEAERFVHLVDA